MTPEAFAKEYQVENAFLVSYGGNITPPFEPVAERMKDIHNIKWSILGDASSPLPDSPLGFTEEIIELAKKYPNITGGVIDDFYAPERLKRFPPEVLQTIQKRLAENGLDLHVTSNKTNIAFLRYWINNITRKSFSSKNLKHNFQIYKYHWKMQLY